MMDAPQTRQVSIDEAARILGLSRRTVERRLTSGRQSGRKDGGRWLVDVTIDAATVQREQADHDRRAIDELTRKVAELTHQAEALTDERDALTRRIDELLADRESWRQQAAMASANCQAALEVRGLLAERAEPTSTTPARARRWWPFGR